MSNYVVKFPSASFQIPQKKKDDNGQTVYKDVIVKMGGEVPDDVEEATLNTLYNAGIIEPVDADAMAARRRRTALAAGDPPAESASQATWAAYAVSRGADEDEAAAMKKDELVAKYGAPAS